MSERLPRWVRTVAQVVGVAMTVGIGLAVLLFVYWVVWIIGALLGFWGNIGY
jgi:hypothetical protein